MSSVFTVTSQQPPPMSTEAQSSDPPSKAATTPSPIIIQAPPAVQFPTLRYPTPEDLFNFETSCKLLQTQYPAASASKNLIEMCSPTVIAFLRATTRTIPANNDELLRALREAVRPQSARESLQLLDAFRLDSRLSTSERLCTRLATHTENFERYCEILGVADPCKAERFLSSIEGPLGTELDSMVSLGRLSDSDFSALAAAAFKVAQQLDSAFNILHEHETGRRLGRLSGETARTTSSSPSPSSSSSSTTASSSSLVPVRPSKLTPEEHDRCLKERLCLRCRQPGHFAAQCPTFSSSGPRVPDSKPQPPACSVPLDNSDTKSSTRHSARTTAGVPPSRFGFSSALSDAEGYDHRPRAELRALLEGGRWVDIDPIIDTGASISTCSRETLEELDVPCEPVPPSKRISVATPDGNVFSPDYFANIAVEIPGGKEKAITRTVKFYVVTPVDESPGPPMSLGLDALSRCHISLVNPSKVMVHLDDKVPY
ncbi:hypothetical protein PAPYR_509 [Paratrimastix pyriformis]|uniref:CCHC-type domain-containing protein n=1 Tax=Paratrimastix pyriformis TaxID=342808 RepID=A0ABQ8UTS8_9EUKA|nr:hypothetical protein PAPYR_509 [Paratrimastix pyriformis]